MRAILLAAGRGKRLGNLTKEIPKPLIKVNGVPLIERNIKYLKENNISEIVINVSYLSDKIISAIGDGSRFGVKIFYSIEKPKPFDTGGGILNTIDFFKNENFLVLNSDVLIDYKIINNEISSGNLCKIILTKNPSHNQKGDFSLNGKKVLSSNNDNLTYTGLSILNPKLFKDIDDKIFSLKSVFDKAIKLEKIEGEFYDGKWVDVGTLERIKIAESLFL